MWIIIRKSDNVVVGTQYDIKPIWDETLFEVKEWLDAAPPIHTPDAPSYDPTLLEPTYPDFQQRKIDFAALKDQATNEIDWLNDNIPLVSSADLATLRAYLERVMREQRQEIRAWRYIFSKFS
ncbi:MAG: hypothetical protein ACXABY_20715 [Candidatus Thorarchaeota archaeon]|jgi:hypothetical protein